METESEEREACLRRHKERDGARWASPTVDQTQARLEHNASYRHTHLQQLATNRQRRLESEMAEESYTRFFFSAISPVYTLVQCLSAMRHGSVSH